MIVSLHSRQPVLGHHRTNPIRLLLQHLQTRPLKRLTVSRYLR